MDSTVLGGIGRTTPLLLAALTFSSGCSDSSGPGGPTTEFSMSFTAVPSATASTATTASAAVAASISDGTHTLELTQVEATFSEIGLEGRVDGPDDDADGGGEDNDIFEDEGGEFEIENVTVNLPVDGGVVTPFTGPIPIGTYRQMGLEIARVRVIGTYDGQPFDETISAEAEAEKTLEPPFVVSAGAERPNVTIALRPFDWFREAEGTLVDPRATNADSGVRGRVRDRIESSLEAFADGNLNGLNDG